MEVGAFNPLVLEIGCEGVAAPLDNAVFVGVVFLRAVVLDDIIPAVVLGLVGRAPADLVTPSALLLAKSNQYKEKEKKKRDDEPLGRLELPTPGLQDQCSNR